MSRSVNHSARRLFAKLNHLVNRFPIGSVRDVVNRLSGAAREYPVIFIVGPPRSGSTLAMQVLTDAFQMGYLSNRHCRWFGDPALAERLLKPLARRQCSDYTSSHGRTNKPDGPTECGAWWYRFFRRQPAYVTLSDVAPRKMLAFRQSIAAFEKAIGKPLIFKNLYAGLRLEPIMHHLPNAIFVVIERDWADNAQSILKGRMDALGSYEPWWSVPPPNVAELSRLPPVQQAVGQIESIHNLIDRDLARLGAEERTFRIHYEDFCRDVHGTLARFEQFMRAHGVDLEPRFEVPSSFAIPGERTIPDRMYSELVAHVSERRTQPGPAVAEAST